MIERKTTRPAPMGLGLAMALPMTTGASNHREAPSLANERRVSLSRDWPLHLANHGRELPHPGSGSVQDLRSRSLSSERRLAACSAKRSSQISGRTALQHNVDN